MEPTVKHKKIIKERSKRCFLYGRYLPFMNSFTNLSLPLLCQRSVLRCRLILGLFGLAAAVVTNTALIAKLALPRAIVVVRETAAFLKLAMPLQVEAAQGVAFPLTLSLEGATNKRLLAACAHAEGSTTTAVALLHVHGVHLHALLVATAISASTSEATGGGNSLEGSTTAASGHLALRRELAAVEASASSTVLLGVHGVGTVDWLHRNRWAFFFSFYFSFGLNNNNNKTTPSKKLIYPHLCTQPRMIGPLEQRKT